VSWVRHRRDCAGVSALFACLLFAVAGVPSRAATTTDSTSAGASRTPPSGSAALVATVEQPRPAGYFVGDLITQRVLLESAGRAVMPAALPAIGRVNAWFERRRVTIETDSSSHRWLVVQYQILNAPPKLTTITLPAWALATRNQAAGASFSHVEPRPGSRSSTPATPVLAGTALGVPAVSIGLAPLSPPGSPTQVGTADLRPDRLPPRIATVPIQRALAFSSAALAFTLAAWVGWILWRNRRAMDRQPFARALREMRVLDDREPQAWQALHRAFDQTAGRVIQNATLPELFVRAPQLMPARAQIERFFAQSSLMFFAHSPPAAGSTPELPYSSGSVPMAPESDGTLMPHALCVELRRIERQHER
jgi:mxaA protein